MVTAEAEAMEAVREEASIEVLLVQSPVEVGKEYDVDITEINRQGDGIARVQGFVVFVQNGKVGSNIKINVTQIGDRSAKATIVV
jgi:predicted RNA-binding protein with TRAM domain